MEKTESVKYPFVFRRDQALMLLLYHGMKANKLEFTRAEVDEFFDRVLADLNFGAHLRTKATGIKQEVICEDVGIDEKILKHAHLVPYKKALSILSWCGFFCDLDEFIEDEYKVLSGQLKEEYEGSMFQLLALPIQESEKFRYLEPLEEDADYTIKIDKKKIEKYISYGEGRGKILLNYVEPLNIDERTKKTLSILNQVGVYEFEADKIENGKEIFADSFYRIRSQAVKYIAKLKNDKKRNVVKTTKSVLKDPHIQLNFFDYLK